MGIMLKNIKKRGASPLIATIVLIAFAVSLGGFFMSIFGIYIENLRAGDCTQFTVSMLEVQDRYECESYSPSTIVHFYESNKNSNPPPCYKVNTTADGGKWCGQRSIFEIDWVPMNSGR